MSVKLIFCTSAMCFQKDIDYVDYLLNLPVEYDELKKNVKYTSGYVIHDEHVIERFWRMYADSPFIPYKCERLEITFTNIWTCEGFGYE